MSLARVDSTLPLFSFFSAAISLRKLQSMALPRTFLLLSQGRSSRICFVVAVQFTPSGADLCWSQHRPLLRGLTFELRRDRRRDARPDGWMINKAGRRAWWLAVGPRLERGVRQRHAKCAPVEGVPRPLALLLACHSCLPLRASDGCVAGLQAARHEIGSTRVNRWRPHQLIILASVVATQITGLIWHGGAKSLALSLPFARRRS